jgi:hypothetical protein
MHMVSTRPFTASNILAALAAFASIAGVPAALATLPTGYSGTPYQGKVQEIPGRVFLSDFDQGPKEMVWHDFQTKNPWACKVRDSTGVGMQLMGQGGDKGDTKEADTLVAARKGKCYLAETNKGDWTKYTVNVKQPGTFKLHMLTAASETTVPFVGVSLLNGADSAGTGQVTLPITTYFHHWVYTRSLSTLSLGAGAQVLRFDIVGNGPMNIDYIDFEWTGTSGLSQASGMGSEAAGLTVGALVRATDGSVSLAFNAADSHAGQPVRIRAFDAMGALLATETVGASAGGNRYRFKAHIALTGLVFVELRQGNSRAVARVPLTGL